MTPGIWRNVLSIGEFIRRIQTLLTPPAMPGVSNDLQFYLIILWRKYQVVEKTIIVYLRSEQTTVRYIQNYYSKILEVLFCLKEVVFYRRLKSFLLFFTILCLLVLSGFDIKKQVVCSRAYYV